MIRFVCSRYRKFRGNTRSMDGDKFNFYQYDYPDDQKYSRGRDGIHCQRKTWTKRAINLEYTCLFYFYVAFDSKGFFVVPGLGNKKKHLYHNQQHATKRRIFFESRHQVSKKTKNL